MAWIKVECFACRKSFFRDARRYNEATKFGWHHFCSAGCRSKFRTKKRRLSCENCGKNFMRQPKAISIHNFCSKSCAAIVNNKKYDHRKSFSEFKICKQCGENYRKSTNNKNFCSKLCRNLALGYDKNKIINILKKLAGELNRTPARREAFGGVDKACIRIFGSWNKAIMGAGLVPNRSCDNKMYKRVISKAKDGHLCDSISEVLIDNWLYKNNIKHEKDAHYPKTNHLADWKIVYEDKEIFVEYFGLANDSPRYDRSIKEKQTLCDEQNIYLISIFPKDLYPKTFLDFNLKNKFKKFLPN